MMLGDKIESVLSLLGITKERVGQWLEKESCTNCQETQDKLNALGFWADRVLGGKVDNALTFLERIIGD